MARRVVVQIRWQRQDRRWVAVFPAGFQGCILDAERTVAMAPPLHAETQAVLVQRMTRYLRMCWTRARALGQLRIYSKHGRILREFTYGRDPRRSRG